MRTPLAAVLVILAASATLAAVALKTEPEPLEPAISLDQARATALERTNGGTIEEEELEREGDLLIYSFDVRLADGGLAEVEVDAASGDVLNGAAEDEDGEDGEDEEDDPDARKGSAPRR